jgi:heptosyltransferase II
MPPLPTPSAAAVPADGTTLVLQPLPGIGDMVWHVPHIHAVARAAGRPVWVMTKPRTRADRLFAGDRSVAGVLWVERNPGRHDGPLGLLRLAALLRPHRFRRVVILHHSWRYAAAARLAGIPERFGYGVGLQRRFLTGPPYLPEAHRKAHPSALPGHFLEAAGIPVEETEPRLVVSDAAAATVAARVGGRPGPWLALGVGSSERFKQWGPARFAELARILAGRGWPSLFLVGGPAEIPFRAAVAEALGEARGRVVDTFDWPVEEVVALLDRCSLLVGNDTGFLNVSAACEVPAMGLFGATPPLTHSRFIHPMLPEAGGPSKEDGMARIPVERVVAELERLGLAEPPAEVRS